MKFIILFFIVGCALALPRNNHKRYAAAARLQAAARPRLVRRAPAHHRTMLISGYYRPLFAQRRTGYEPETAMTAFATGDSVAAGSYLGSQAAPCASCGEQDNTEFIVAPEVQNPELDQSQLEEEAPVGDFPEAPEGFVQEQPDSEVADPKPARTPKKKPSKKVEQPEDDGSDEIGEEPASVLKAGRGPHNSFFPIVFGGYPGGARSGASAGAPGVTAIANSYSTGKGGVATSHATAYGSGAPSRSRKRAETPAEDDDE